MDGKVEFQRECFIRVPGAATVREVPDGAAGYQLRLGPPEPAGGPPGQPAPQLLLSFKIAHRLYQSRNESLLYTFYLLPLLNGMVSLYGWLPRDSHC